MISEKQKNKFLDITGYEYGDRGVKGYFRTEFPYNKKDYKYSPYGVYYIFDEDTNHLYIGMTHRMTNWQVYVFNEEGIKVEVGDNKHITTIGSDRVLNGFFGE